MGLFTDVYNVGAAVGKPVAGIVRFGAKKADEFVDSIVSPAENSNTAPTNNTTNTANAEVRGTVVVSRMEDLTGGEVAKLYKLAAKGHSPEDIAEILSTEDRVITVKAIVDTEEKLN